MTRRQQDILLHILGIDTPWLREPKSYRNHYCAAGDDQDLLQLEADGMVVLRQKPASWEPEYRLYCCTKKGEAEALKIFYQRRWKKSKRVYRVFLELRDCLNISFRDFLTDPRFSENRSQA